MFTGLLLATLSGIGWASADVLRKQLTADIEPLRLSIQLALIQLAVVALFAGVVLFPAEIAGWSELRLDRGYWIYAVPGYICTAAGHFLFIKALRTSELSLTIPFLSFSPIFVMGMGIVLLGEWPTVMTCIGVSIVALAAVFLRGTSTGLPSGEASQEDDIAFRRGRTLMLATAAAWSAAAAFDKGATAHSSPLTHLILLLGATWGLLAVYSAVTGQGARPNESADSVPERSQVGWLWATSAVMVLSLAVQLAAYAYWDVAYVEAIKRALGLVCSVVFGAMLFKETDAMSRLPAVVAMAIGSACILLGS